MKRPYLPLLLLAATTTVFGPAVLCARMDQLQILDGLLTSAYDRRATPTNHLNNATTVHCELYIRSFGSISPVTMDYEVDLYLRQKWQDSRLRHSNITEPLDLNDPNLVKAIWKPEVYFPNAKHAEFQFVTVPNVLVRIHPDGEILYMLRLKLTFSCMMDLSKFPLDSQVCTMEVASFSKTIEELSLEWKTLNPVIMGKGLRMPQFEIVKIAASDCQESFQIGNYSCLVAEFHLSRSVGYHLVQSYLPTMLIVVISWVSFWMDVDSVPGRTTLGVTTLLAVSSQSSGIQSGLPQVSYVKAIDVWMGTCTAFVFCALLEFTIVNYMWRKSSDPLLAAVGMSADAVTTNGKAATAGAATTATTPPEAATGAGADAAVVRTPTLAAEDDYLELATVGGRLGHFHEASPLRAGDDRDEVSYVFSDDTAGRARVYCKGGCPPAIAAFPRHKLRARRIDEMSRLCFPLAFACFNLLYWAYYLVW
ncbi:glycine receptor subunit alpha-3-like [Schistocerca cancellata]|uniref:glycine receptor subunit alpha-3-like n=1 Tax=Schistocerca cancellata TaxID=274614 RepID=UPI002118E7D0|nr:glycine receptor subunit alpha-3-like [Schistocerca cancellata]